MGKGDTTPRGARELRGHERILVDVALFVLGIVVLASMAINAHSLAYFPGDVSISHAVQAYSSDWLDAALGAGRWTRFPPQSDILFGISVMLLVVLGARWAAISETIAGLGS